MIFLLEIVVGVYAFGTLVMFLGMSTAPEAYEDEDGFHMVDDNSSDTHVGEPVTVSTGGRS